MEVFDGFCISSAIHTHSSNTYARPERRRREDERKKKQQLDHPPHRNSLILSFGSFMFSLFKSFLCSNLSIWLDRPVVPNGSRCYISILDGLVGVAFQKRANSPRVFNSPLFLRQIAFQLFFCIFQYKFNSKFQSVM